MSHCVLFPVMYTYATYAVLMYYTYTDNKYANFAYAPFATVGDIHLGTSSTTTTWAQLAIRNQPPILVVFTKNGKFTKPGSF